VMSAEPKFKVWYVDDLPNPSYSGRCWDGKRTATLRR
jgi:hypothetical protein